MTKGEVRPGAIHLEIAKADREHEKWERRFGALCQMYAVDRRFVDRDGQWGLRDFLDYAGQVCGFTAP
jgi:hypothetical protein